ncbi:hypothetical protein [Microvirga sp. VF16]|uniref:hypothetical protein n=1 Tax=Microvirga sp. VF16 TaxID=2807101 RepID=UPI00193DB4B1|nr:hypothetical protein [Microvirga sp. VF16]QRM34419.1 hypothetical protein JO965_35070 [Microvirga sp. VF16]
MSFTLQPVRVATGADEEGRLVFDEEQRLVAVLTHLAEANEVAPDHWYLEAGFGPVGEISRPTFADLEAAQDWLDERLASGR